MNDSGLLFLLVVGFSLIVVGSFIVGTAAGMIITGAIIVGSVVAYARPRA